MKLAENERAFLRLVARAVVSNPFDDERDAVDAELAGRVPGESEDETRTRVGEVVRQRLEEMERDGKADLSRLHGDDRETLSYAFLFDIYHRFRADFDEHIRQQFESGESPIEVPFAAEGLRLLVGRGFEPEIAARHFAMFFQLRRAYHFIDRALIGTSPAMRRFRRDLWNGIFTSDIRWYDRYLRNRMEDFSTLLLGETGSGKGSAAAAIGRSGFIPFDERRQRFAESFTRAFVALNLSQFHEGLIESELFGHRKGAFTGAVDDHTGAFARCSPYGSVFLDEIGDVSVPVQIKLLQVIQEREFCPVGSHEVKRFRGRVIAATNRGLDELREQGKFRDDFFYRLSSDIILVPSLRERLAQDRDELALLVRHCVERLLGEPVEEIVGLVHTTIETQVGRDYTWPGNVRELEQCVRRIILKRHYDGQRVRAPAGPREDIERAVETGALDAQSLLCAYCALLYEREGSFEGVGRITGLDRRTVRKYVKRWRAERDLLTDDDQSSQDDEEEETP